MCLHNNYKSENADQRCKWTAYVIVMQAINFSQNDVNIFIKMYNAA